MVPDIPVSARNSLLKVREAVSIGGLVAPPLGAAAQAYGPQGVFTILCATPVLALVLGSLFLTEPDTRD